MISAYLPSAKFVTIALSLLLSGGLVTGAQYITKQPGLGSISSAPTNPQTQSPWEQTLEEIQLESGITAPIPPSAEVVSQFLTDAQSANLTTSVGRTLLVNLSSANAEGLGTDVPTQEAIISEAAAKVGSGIKGSYTTAEVLKVPQNKDSLHQYGNILMQTFLSYPAANTAEVLYAFGDTVDYQDTARLGPVRAAEAAYGTIAEAMMQLPVPETLAPLHVQLANNFYVMGKSAGEMAAVVSDPLRGLGGLQLFQTSGDEAGRLLTTIANILNNNGILFTNDDPGVAWSAFVASP